MMSVFWGLLFALVCSTTSSPERKTTDPRKRATNRTFVIDYKNDRFLKDGEPFQYIAGTMHYFRVVPESWQDRMEKMKFAGLDAVETYIEWRSHEPESSVYDFDGINDFEKFVQTAEKVGLSVILRVGPFIDAERDMGGFPYWLLAKNPQMKLRSSDPSYLHYVQRWLKVLLPKVKPLLYVNGGPIIMVQIENEYGSYSTCDYAYTSWLRDTFRAELGKDVVLFTTDPPHDSGLRCGKVDEVYATVDFGPTSNPAQYFQVQKRHQASGPSVNSEYYPGWFDDWGVPHSKKSTSEVVTGMEKMIQMNASFSFYVFEGGTSFGFGAGANFDSGTKKYLANPTSYDYDAPLTEAGDPTEKYFAIRSTISKYRRLPPGKPPKPSPKMSLGPITMQKSFNIYDLRDGNMHSEQSNYPLSFEALGISGGFVMYSTKVSVNPTVPVKLTITDLRDRAIVFVDKKYQGTLSRSEYLDSMPLNCKYGSQIDIVVENQGRPAYGDAISESKGISNVTIGNTLLTGWNHTILFKNWSKPFKGWDGDLLLKKNIDSSLEDDMVPSLYFGRFQVNETLQDTFLNVDAWGKGVAILNGNNLGRYWPVMGPQRTLYVPKTFFKAAPAMNTLVLFELEKAPCNQTYDCTIRFVKDHVIDGSTPNS